MIAVSLKVRRGCLKQTLLGVGCPAYVPNYYIQHGQHLLDTDLQVLIIKTCNYFSVYTVCVESLKDFCEFVDVEYQQLLNCNKT